MNRNRLFTKAFAGIICPLLILIPLGCASKKKPIVAMEPPSTQIRASVRSSTDLNPDLKGKPSSLYAILYELKAPNAFNSSSFFELYDGEVADFEKELVRKEEIEIDPGYAFNLERKLKPESRFIGILAAYRDIDNAQWRALAKVEPGKTIDLNIDFTRLAVTIEKSKPAPAAAPAKEKDDAYP